MMFNRTSLIIHLVFTALTQSYRCLHNGARHCVSPYAYDSTLHRAEVVHLVPEEVAVVESDEDDEPHVVRTGPSLMYAMGRTIN